MIGESILVFGGGPLQLSIIKKSIQMGYRTIVIDPDIDAPAKKITDAFIAVAGDDFDKTIQIARDNNVKGIVTAATDKPILMMCKIAKELDFPFPSFESCENVLDKSRFKQFLETNDFPHAKGIELKGISNVPLLNFGFPVIIKPIMNSGSRGVIKCNSDYELKDAIKETLLHSQDERYLIEEYIEGDEISIEALVQNYKVHILQITDKIVTPPPYNVELGHIQPSKYEYFKNSIKQLLQAIVDKSGLNNCALHPELKISDNKMTLMEIGPRLGGDFITSHLVPLSTGVNMEEQIINIAVGNDIKYERSNGASMISYMNFPIGEKIMKSISEDEMTEKFPAIREFSIDLNVGEEIKQITNSLNRYGHFVLSGENRQSLLVQSEVIISVIEDHIF